MQDKLLEVSLKDLREKSLPIQILAIFGVLENSINIQYCFIYILVQYYANLDITLIKK